MADIELYGRVISHCVHSGDKARFRTGYELLKWVQTEVLQGHLSKSPHSIGGRSKSPYSITTPWIAVARFSRHYLTPQELMSLLEDFFPAASKREGKAPDVLAAAHVFSAALAAFGRKHLQIAHDTIMRVYTGKGYPGLLSDQLQLPDEDVMAPYTQLASMPVSYTHLTLPTIYSV